MGLRKECVGSRLYTGYVLESILQYIIFVICLLYLNIRIQIWDLNPRVSKLIFCDVAMEKWQRDVSRCENENVTHDDVSRVVRNGYFYFILIYSYFDRGKWYFPLLPGQGEQIVAKVAGELLCLWICSSLRAIKWSFGFRPVMFRVSYGFPRRISSLYLICQFLYPLPSRLQITTRIRLYSYVLLFLERETGPDYLPVL